MITLSTFKQLQIVYEKLLRGEVFMGPALHSIFRGENLVPEEKGLIRDLMFRCVQLKNRYRHMVEKFTEAFPEKEDNPLDLRLMFLCYYYEPGQRTKLEAAVHRMLYDKARVRRLVHFLKTTPVENLFPSPKKEALTYFWEYHSHPLWMIRKWQGLFTFKEIMHLCQYNNQPPEVVLRVNPLRTNREAILDRLKAEGYRPEISPYSPLAIMVDGSFEPMVHEGYRGSLFTLQGISSQLVTFYINPRAGQRVLDYCAGEGGKTLLMSHIMNGKGEICAHDQNPSRLKRLRTRVKKEGVSNVRVTGDTDALKEGAPFDLVLVDAPCSGSGNLRHQPEIRWKLKQADLEEMNLLQLKILSESSTLCAKGGLLFYVTCSIFQEENHKVVRRFLNLNPDWSLVTPGDFLKNHHSRDFWLSAKEFKPFLNDSYFRIHPARLPLPGMFCAVLTRLS